MQKTILLYLFVLCALTSVEWTATAQDVIIRRGGKRSFRPVVSLSPSTDIPVSPIQNAPLQSQQPTDEKEKSAFSRAISMYQYNKTREQKTESFLLTNNTHHLVSSITLKIVYKTVHDEMIDYRTHIIAQEIEPKATKKIEIEGFDNNKTYYYHVPSTPYLKTGIPYHIEWELLRYDVAILP